MQVVQKGVSCCNQKSDKAKKNRNIVKETDRKKRGEVLGWNQRSTQAVSPSRGHSSQHASMTLRIGAPALFALGPALDSNHYCCPRHEQRRESHDDGEDEHGVKVVRFQRRNSILVADHEGNSAGDKAKRRDDFSGWARWEERRRRRDVHCDVCEAARERKAHEHAAPLGVDHC